MPLNLTLETDRDKLAELIMADIDQWCSSTYNEGHRTHLGASIMGDDCARRLWYTFRWVKLQVFEGRIQRLFQVGHMAEPRFKTYLEAIGFEVNRLDPETGKQYRMSACNGHYGGSLDALITAPARYEISEDLIFLGEFKTNGTGAGYSGVSDKGLRSAKPKHFAQMSQYGKAFQLRYGIYLIENKNDSDITIEIVPLDWNLGQQLEDKAQRIINSKVPPNRISEQPVYWECKTCTFNSICHDNAPVEKNCRSCRYAEPIADAKWFCSKHFGEIPRDFIAKGCNDHVSINGE